MVRFEIKFSEPAKFKVGFAESNKTINVNIGNVQRYVPKNYGLITYDGSKLTVS